MGGACGDLTILELLTPGDLGSMKCKQPPTSEPGDPQPPDGDPSFVTTHRTGTPRMTSLFGGPWGEEADGGPLRLGEEGVHEQDGAGTGRAVE